ncbi:YciI family protein [Streptosporangium saharense]|uniref:YciI family protein n=1 Tax=Streptosporangium saharense TaxID=1706840 RepID=UPI0033177487
MKFLLIMHMNPEIWDSLTDEERKEVMNGHQPFIEAVQKSGELVGHQVLEGPATSAVVRVSDGVPVVSDGPYLETKEYLAGFYMINCESRERAFELAAMIPDASVPGIGIEVRPVMFSAGSPV